MQARTTPRLQLYIATSGTGSCSLPYPLIDFRPGNFHHPRPLLKLAPEKRANHFAFYDDRQKSWVVEKDAFTIAVGGSSRDLPLRADFQTAETIILK